MDIRKLQRAIVDGLEDVKGHDIAVFNTEHLSPLFERVIIASGTSNRQTKALAASVRDAVKASGHGVLRTEGEANGEWIIVDCGAAVVHLMQPSIREYYHLEEIWGGKPVKMKIDNAPKRLVKAESEKPASTRTARSAAAKPAKAPAKSAVKKPATAGKAAVAKPSAPKKSAATTAVRSAPKAPTRSAVSTSTRAAPAKKGLVARKPAARPVAVKQAATKTIKVGLPAAKRKPAGASRQPASRAAAGVVRTVGVKRPAAAKKAPR